MRKTRKVATVAVKKLNSVVKQPYETKLARQNLTKMAVKPKHLNLYQIFHYFCLSLDFFLVAILPLV